MRTRALGLVLAALLATTTLTVPSVSAETTDALPPVGQGVVAVIDTGINPYHEEFRDSSPLAYQHPSTYIDGFPEDAVALELTLDAPDHESALAADCELWRTVERGQLYWFPGTRVIGGISFQNATAQCSDAGQLVGEVHILDGGGHGTMTASRAAASTYGACPTCRVVAIEYTGSVNLVSPGGSERAPMEAIGFAAANRDWIDVQSNSWGPIVPAYDPTSAAGLLAANPEFIGEVERVSAAMPAFWASGNGAAFRGGVIGHPTPLTPHATPSAIMVGGHDSGYVNTWPGFPPHLVSDSCSAWAARHDSVDESGDTVASGTSGATPFVAGGGVQILVEARRLLGDTATGQADDGLMARGDPGVITEGPLADGELSRDEWQRIIFTTATDRPAGQFEDGPPCGPLNAPYNETPVRWTDVPAGYPEHLHIGYGAVDGPALDLAEAVLAGDAELPDRTPTDAYFALHHTIGDTTHDIYTTP